MTDIIRDAVELADGFHVLPGGLYQTPRGNAVEHQIYLDALAAQLERQYIASFEGMVAVVKYFSYCRDLRKQSIGTDLTMWRIEYFVRVLK